MTPPIHDREQAVQTVRRVLYPHGDEFAEQIVDALGIGKPDPEIERVDGVRWFTELLVREQVKVVLERTERAEERLREVTEAANALMVGWRNYEIKTYTAKGQRLLNALRAVLSDNQRVRKEYFGT